MSTVLLKDKQIIVNKSLEASIDLLRDKHMAFLVRSTGFGKTWIGSEIAKTTKVTGKHWDKVIFIVPLLSIQEGIEEKYKDKLKGVNYKFISYQNLGFQYKRLMKGTDVVDLVKDLEGMDNGLFIFEEAHKFGYMGENQAGANKSSNFIKKIKERFPNAYYFGSTATPYRTDGADVGYTFFEGNLVFPYTIHDALEDGYYRKPLYIYGEIGIEELSDSLQEKILDSKTLSKDKKGEEIEKMKADLVKFADINNMPTIIKEGVNSADCPQNYMRFLIFFPNTVSLNARREDVVKWFGEAFPDKNIRVTVVISGTSMDDIDEEDCGNMVYDLDTPDGTIDIILSINKLIMGYHDKHITGVMLIRLTTSDIIYRQIIGRCFDMEINHQTIIFDIVGNYSTFSNPTENTYRIIDRDDSNKGDYLDYVGALNESVVEVFGFKKDIKDIKRMYDFDRIQHERELVWNFKNGRFDAVFCASELKIDVASWNNVVANHSDITGNEAHGEY